jgi:glycosyltransferase involved in cell wall biosynthesis
MRPDAPLVSVLIPLYNHERYIVQCLDSILADPYPAKEILLVDDGSRDSSAAMARQWYEAKRERFSGRFELLSRENRGLTRTLNQLVDMARGEFVVIVASDDYLLPGGIQARLDYLLEHPDKVAVFGDCLVVDENGVQTHSSGIARLHRGSKSRLKHGRLVNYELVFHWCVPGPVFMGRRDLYRQVGGYDERLAVEDWDFYLRLAARDGVGFVDTPVAAYRVHSQSFSRSPEKSRSYNVSTLEAVSGNLARFMGLRKVYLLGERLKLLGVIARMDGRASLKSFCRLKAGRLLLVVSKRLYHLAAPFMRE